ncbi:MAG: lipoprotein-releasing ABC transporter permease subunit [Alphaproteobacteria bacterium]|nr:lipoprotein-releasing ABC transporter permease subunit [Alphaproteobacteria bacterium]MCD8525791.1 lipoprotein-releasing ABC transporter permease subunit [Alphaproteobacteria bacterium]MCD8570097.1 lipoprotein-releasing ABC transporter permease subunit [Alphaproteobacteria bacterium]
MIFNAFERMVAFRYLRSKKAEGFVSVIAGFSFMGIMLGVATLIIVMSVMNGFRQELFSRILGLNGHMNVYTAAGPLYDYDFLAGQVRPVQGVESVTPIIESQSLLSQGGNSSGVMVRGIKPEDFEARDILRTSIQEGTLDNFKAGQVAVGSVLAKKMNLKVGDKITLTSTKVRSTPFGTVPRQRSFDVGIIFDVGMYEYNSGFAFINLEAAQTFFQLPGAVTALEIFLKNPEKLDQVRKEVSHIVEGQAGVYDWRDMNASFYNALKTERNVMFLILTMIILVAAFNVISSMIMLVKDKGRDIAVMRTMGASSTNMLKIFILTGASIGVMGTLFGAALGISFALNIESIRQFLEGLSGAELFSDEIYFLSKLPAEIDWSEVTAVLGMAFFLSIAATLYPAWRASRLDPVEALRYE